MRMVFMGTPSYAAIILEQLAAHHDVVGVYTAEDKVRSRGNTATSTPVKKLACELGLSVYTPRSLRDASVTAQLAALEPEVICVAAYGKILPQEVLDIPSYGCINVHASALPRWRGAAPIQRAILAGDEELGVSIMQVEAGLDTGCYTQVRKISAGEKSAAELTEELARAGAEALLCALDELKAGSIAWTTQDESLVTYAEKIAKGELNLSPEDSVEGALRKVRASDVEHPAKCVIGGRVVAVVSARRAHIDVSPPAEAKLQNKMLVLGFSDGSVEVTCVKPNGKAEMNGTAFAAGVQGIKAGVFWSALSESEH